MFRKKGPYLRYVAGVLTKYESIPLAKGFSRVSVGADDKIQYCLELKDDGKLASLELGKKYIILYYIYNDKPNEFIRHFELAD